MATSFLKLKNNARSYLSASISDSDTSLTLASDDGASFPSTYPFDITINNEILRCTSRATDTLTVERAQQGTTATSHDQYDAVELRITAKHFDDITEIFASNQIVCHENQVVCHENNVLLNV